MVNTNRWWVAPLAALALSESTPVLAQVDVPPPPILTPIPSLQPPPASAVPAPPASAPSPGSGIAPPPPSSLQPPQPGASLAPPAGVSPSIPAAPAPVRPRERVTVEGANVAIFNGVVPAQQRNLTTRLQVLLDRAGVSPGVIDGYPGENVEKSVAAFEQIYGFPVDGIVDTEVWGVLAADAEPVLVPYLVTAEDLVGPFLGVVPRDYAEMALLTRVGYATPAEMFAERFHMDIDLLRELNPGIATVTAGATLTVAAVGRNLRLSIARIEADKTLGQLRGYDLEGRLIVAYPATIGSTDTPSPSGIHAITVVVTEASYTYRPQVNFQQGNNVSVLTIPPGPNNPVGGIWIDLTEPTYGIHGTPEPSLIDKTFSHGCVRLTNWDARELAGMVREGVTVDFI